MKPHGLCNALSLRSCTETWTDIQIMHAPTHAVHSLRFLQLIVNGEVLIDNINLCPNTPPPTNSPPPPPPAALCFFLFDSALFFFPSISFSFSFFADVHLFSYFFFLSLSVSLGGLGQVLRKEKGITQVVAWRLGQAERQQLSRPIILSPADGAVSVKIISRLRTPCGCWPAKINHKAANTR